MVNTNIQEHPKTESRAHVMGYLAGDIIGIAAGFVGAKFLFDEFGVPTWLAAFSGFVLAGVVAGGVLLLVCYLSGRWEEDILAYFGGTASADYTSTAPVDYKCTAQGEQKHYLKTNRGLIKYILLNIITFNIYGIVILTSVGKDINLIAGKYDGKKTMNYCWIYFLLTGLTLGIAPIVWFHKISARIGQELNRRGIAYQFGAGSFWGWNLLGMFIAIGPMIYMHKLLKAMNLLSSHYNTNEYSENHMGVLN